MSIPRPSPGAAQARWPAGLAGLARRCGAALLAACLVMAPAQAAKDTPLGIEMVPARFPDSSVEDVVRALAITAIVGSHASKITPWSDATAMALVPGLVQLARAQGLKTLVQLGTIFLGNPAPPAGFGTSFGDPVTRARFLDDVRILAAMQPDYLVLTTEVNLMHRFNRAEFDHFRTLHAQAYDAIKRIAPQTQVGVSYLDSLWFANYHIDGVDVPALMQPADFLAFTSYPEWLVREGHFTSIAAIPPEWYGATRAAYPNARIVYSEIGWASKVRGTPELQAEFVRQLPRLMSLARPELITWAVLHDMEFYNRSLLTPESTAFLEGLGVDIDALFGHFNGMGLLDGFGNPKPALGEAALLVFPRP